MNRDELERLIGAPAYLHPDELEPFCRYAAQATGVLVELGTGYGATAACWPAPNTRTTYRLGHQRARRR